MQLGRRSGRLPRTRAALLCAGGLVLAVLSADPARAQDRLPPNRGGFTTSMGIPPAYVNLGLYRDLLNPMTSALGVLGEAYGGTRGTLSETEGVDGGVRLALFSPITRIAFGGDYNLRDHGLDFFVSLIHPFQRGGILRAGRFASTTSRDEATRWVWG